QHPLRRVQPRCSLGGSASPQRGGASVRRCYGRVLQNPSAQVASELHPPPDERSPKDSRQSSSIAAFPPERSQSSHGFRKEGSTCSEPLTPVLPGEQSGECAIRGRHLRRNG